jgi:hypothetical protein
VYIDTRSPVPNIPSKSRGLVDEIKKTFDGMEMIRNKCIAIAILVLICYMFLFVVDEKGCFY